MTSTAATLDFVENGRTYTCRIEALPRGSASGWWWFGVSGDDSRYAPFRAAADDTPASVRPRVVAYYEDRLARRGGAPWRDRGDAPAGALAAPGAGDAPAAV